MKVQQSLSLRMKRQQAWINYKKIVKKDKINNDT